MIVFLYVLVAILSLLVIGIILIQPSKSGGMGAASAESANRCSGRRPAAI